MSCGKAGSGQRFMARRLHYDSALTETASELSGLEEKRPRRVAAGDPIRGWLAMSRICKWRERNRVPTCSSGAEPSEKSEIPRTKPQEPNPKDQTAASENAFDSWNSILEFGFCSWQSSTDEWRKPCRPCKMSTICAHQKSLTPTRA